MSTGSASKTAVNCLISKLLHHWANRPGKARGDARSRGCWCPVQLAVTPRNPQCFNSSEDYSLTAANFSKQN